MLNEVTMMLFLTYCYVYVRLRLFQVVTCITGVIFFRRAKANAKRAWSATASPRRACLYSPEKHEEITSVMQTIQVVKTGMITLRLLSYHSAYSHCVVLFHHFFGKHGGQSNNRGFFRMISLETKTMSTR